MIPENELSSTSIAVSSASQVTNPTLHVENNKQKTILSTPPWKGGPSDGQNSSLSKYSPAFKRKPFTVYSTGNVKPPTSKHNNQSKSPTEGQKSDGNRVSVSSTNQMVSKPVISTNPLPTGRQSLVNNNSSKRNLKDSSERPLTSTSRKPNNAMVNKIDVDSDNDSAVSSARSSLSHSSGSGCVSPPSSPPLGTNDKQESENNSMRQQDIKRSHFSDRTKDPETNINKQETTRTQSLDIAAGNDKTNINQLPSDSNPRVLKKHSVEAINRRNILESCKKSSAKDTVLIPQSDNKVKTADGSQVPDPTNSSLQSVQKAVKSSKTELNSMNMSRINPPIAKERRSISSTSRTTSLPLGIYSKI